MSVCLAIVFKKSFLVLNNFSDQVKEEKEEAKMSGVIMEQNGFRSRSEIVAEDLGERDMSPPMVRNKFIFGACPLYVMLTKTQPKSKTIVDQTNQWNE